MEQIDVSADRSRRNTPAIKITIGDIRLFFSYGTCIGASGPSLADPAVRSYFRRHNEWGPTTGRHISEFGIRDWPELDAKDFDTRLNDLFTQQAIGIVHQHMAQGEGK